MTTQPTRAQQLAAVPETIDRADYRRMIEHIGLDPYDLLSLTWHSHSIEAEIYALDSKGLRYFNYDNETVATHKVHITIVDEPAEPATGGGR